MQLSAKFLLGTGLVILSTLMYSTGPAELFCGLGAGIGSASGSSSGIGASGSGLSASSSSAGADASVGASSDGGKGVGHYTKAVVHGGGALGVGGGKGAIPLTDLEEAQGLLQDIELTNVDAAAGGGGVEASFSPRVEAAGSHRRRALFG